MAWITMGSSPGSSSRTTTLQRPAGAIGADDEISAGTGTTRMGWHAGCLTSRTPCFRAVHAVHRRQGYPVYGAGQGSVAKPRPRSDAGHDPEDWRVRRPRFRLDAGGRVRLATGRCFEMELSGLLSNPDTTERLDRAADAMAKRSPEVPRRRSQPAIAARHGRARRGIWRSWRAHSLQRLRPRSMSDAQGIPDALRVVCDGESALSDEAGKRKPRVVRGAEGGYRLVTRDAD
jgi:hypothetical protein